jgi:hypothetical protein
VNLNALAKKAAKGPAPAAYGGAMNVEDMIRFVLFHGSAAADEIERLQHQHQWVMDGLLPDGTRVAPYGRWAIACVAYGREGIEGLLPLLRDPDMASFAVSVLENVRSREAVNALIGFCHSATWKSPDPQHADWKALGALNLLLSFDDHVDVEPSMSDELRNIAYSAFHSAATSTLQTHALCVLRGAPSQEALKWMQTLTISDSKTDEIRKLCVKAIRDKLTSGQKTLSPEQTRQVRRQRAADV